MDEVHDEREPSARAAMGGVGALAHSKSCKCVRNRAVYSLSSLVSIL